MFTRKRLAYITVFLCVVYFYLMTLLPEYIFADRTDSIFMFTMKIAFLSMSFAIVTTLTLIIIFKNDFVRGQLATLNKFKYLLGLMVKRDFNTRYRKNFLGVLWSLLNPLLNMLVLTLVFSFLFRSEIPNYPVYLLSGQIIFAFFNESTTQAMYSVIGGEGIIKKVYVPKYIFPVSRVLSSLVNLLFSLIAFFLVVIFTRAPFHWTMLLIPIPIIYTFVFSLGIAMLLSSMAVFFRDLTYLYGIFLIMLMYLTPLFYPVSIVPGRLRMLLGLNPIYHFVEYMRDLAIYGFVPGLWDNMVCLGFSLAALCIGAFVFMNQQDKHILYL